MNFLADIGISPKTVDFLRGLGHDAVHVSELGLPTASDPSILEQARLGNQTLLTHDLGFGELLAVGGSPSSGNEGGSAEKGAPCKYVLSFHSWSR